MDLQPTQAWAPILALVIFTALCLLAGAGGILRYTFPVGALLVGAYLYQRYPILYMGFTWWLWFLIAWLARVVDLQAGWDEQRVMLITPVLVTSLCAITVFKHLPTSCSRGGMPFVLGIVGVCYGFFLGLVQHPVFPVVRALIDWLPPVLFGFHIYINWRDYPNYRQNLLRVFLWGVLVMGAYGVYQYMVAPEWDRYWLTSSGIKSMGSPTPRGMRVFGTLHSTGPYASVLMAGLMLLFANPSPLKPVVAGAGYLGFLLSSVRSVWGGWFVAVIIHMSSLKSNLQMRLIVAATIMMVCVIPLSQVQPFAGVIGPRLQSLTNLGNDRSFNARTEIYDENFNSALLQGLGNGLGAITRENVVDSGVIELLWTLGWMGTLPYLIGILLLFMAALMHTESRFDPFVSVSRAISVSIVLQLIIASTMLGVSGMMLWGFLGFTAAAHQYYKHRPPPL
ncbi:glucose-6-phosphate isomerase [filamentous cyanobacterium CCP4]|nr:glucose-6-phosphate isomerase [filamentous cyanobacterium CCP4]